MIVSNYYYTEKYGVVDIIKAAKICKRSNAEIYSRMRRCNHDINIAMDNVYWKERVIRVNRPHVYKGINFSSAHFAKYYNTTKKYASAWLCAALRGEMSIEEAIEGIKSKQTQPTRKYIKGTPTREWDNLRNE